LSEQATGLAGLWRGDSLPKRATTTTTTIMAIMAPCESTMPPVEGPAAPASLSIVPPLLSGPPSPASGKFPVSAMSLCLPIGCLVGWLVGWVVVCVLVSGNFSRWNDKTNDRGTSSGGCENQKRGRSRQQDREMGMGREGCVLCRWGVTDEYIGRTTGVARQTRREGKQASDWSNTPEL
jgi:hypothetical protein